MLNFKCPNQSNKHFVGLMKYSQNLTTDKVKNKAVIFKRIISLTVVFGHNEGNQKKKKD